MEPSTIRAVFLANGSAAQRGGAAQRSGATYTHRYRYVHHIEQRDVAASLGGIADRPPLRGEYAGSIPVGSCALKLAGGRGRQSWLVSASLMSLDSSVDVKTDSSLRRPIYRRTEDGAKEVDSLSVG